MNQKQIDSRAKALAGQAVSEIQAVAASGLDSPDDCVTIVKWAILKACNEVQQNCEGCKDKAELTEMLGEVRLILDTGLVEIAEALRVKPLSDVSCPYTHEMIMQAIQEQQAEIERLKEENAEQSADLDARSNVRIILNAPRQMIHRLKRIEDSAQNLGREARSAVDRLNEVIREATDEDGAK